MFPSHLISQECVMCANHLISHSRCFLPSLSFSSHGGRGASLVFRWMLAGLSAMPMSAGLWITAPPTLHLTPDPTSPSSYRWLRRVPRGERASLATTWVTTPADNKARARVQLNRRLTSASRVNSPQPGISIPPTTHPRSCRQSADGHLHGSVTVCLLLSRFFMQ